jgi:type IV secretion system protein VirB10
MGLMAVMGISISGALIWGLYQGHRKTHSATELYNTANKQTADGLTTLPRDYTGLPRDVPPLGPPLPGDLGRPIRNAQLNGLGEPAVDVEQQRVAQETEAARTSRLFATTNTREHPPYRRSRDLPYHLDVARGRRSIPTRS